LLGTGICAADSNWTITVKNTSKVPADVTIFSESKAVKNKATAVKPDGGTATIAIPATGPAYKSKYSWKAEYGGKVSAPLDQRLEEQAKTLRKEAKGTPPGVERNKLIRRARQAETAAHIQEWLKSPGLQAPR